MGTRDVSAAGMREAEELEKHGLPGMVHASDTFLDLLSESEGGEESGRKAGDRAKKEEEEEERSLRLEEAEMRYAKLAADLCGWGLEAVRVARGRARASAILRRERVFLAGSGGGRSLDAHDNSCSSMPIVNASFPPKKRRAGTHSG